MANLPAPQNRFISPMIEDDGVLIPHLCGFPNVNDMEQIEEFVEALMGIAHETVYIWLDDVAFQGVDEVQAHTGIERICEALSRTSMTTFALSLGETVDDLLPPQWQQDELTSTFLRKFVARNRSVRELWLDSVRGDEALALALQECSNLTHLWFEGCQLVDQDLCDPIAEAMRDSNVESLHFCTSNPLNTFTSRILAAARGFTKLKELSLNLMMDDRVERAFFKDNNHNTLESLIISFDQDDHRGLKNASRRFGSTLNLIRESPIRIQSLHITRVYLESLQDAHTLLSLFNSEDRCLRQLLLDNRISLEALALILRGLHRSTTLTVLKIPAPTIQGVGGMFGDMLRHNDTLEELCIDCALLGNDISSPEASGSVVGGP